MTIFRLQKITWFTLVFLTVLTVLPIYKTGYASIFTPPSSIPQIYQSCPFHKYYYQSHYYPKGQCSSSSNDDLLCIHLSSIISQRVMGRELELLTDGRRRLLPGWSDEVATVISLGTALSSSVSHNLQQSYLVYIVYICILIVNFSSNDLSCLAR